VNIDFKLFKLEAQKIANIYKDEMPRYFREIEKLGSIPFYHKKYATKRGNSEPICIVDEESVEFVDILKKFHKTRVIELGELGWIL
jgi:hypothetical protein